ncbi:MAG: hypothetical protein HC875_10395 [Anaerolineales bacterium]|nr:hypothetical protein [Anaerolineales bacterium]
MPDIRVDFQNVGNALPVDACPGGTSTLLGYHLYRQDGSIACSNCEGIRSIPLCWRDGVAIPPGKNHISDDLDLFIPDNSAIVKGNTYLLRFDIRRNGVWQGRNANFPWPPQDIPVTICTSGGGSGAPEASVNRPPAVVNYNNLVGDRYGFSWSGRNATSYDLQWKSKEIWESTFPDSWVALPEFQNMNATVAQFSSPIDCSRDHRDWRFRLRAKNSNQTGDWVIIRSRMRIWPHPWLSYWDIGALVLNSDPGPWSRPEDLINYGGGTFNWTVSDNQSWITTNSSGQGIGSLGVVVSKPGGVGTYSGLITVNMTNPSFGKFCNIGPSSVIQCNNSPSAITCNVPVQVGVADFFRYEYLPIILKNSQ